MDEKKAYLTKADILGQTDITTEDVLVPEWADAWVRVKVMTAAERDSFEASTVSFQGKKRTVNMQGIRARLCILCLVNEDGTRMFTEEDEYALGTKSAAAVDRIFTVCQRINGLTAEDVEALEKNSPAVLPADLPSA